MKLLWYSARDLEGQLKQLELPRPLRATRLQSEAQVQDAISRAVLLCAFLLWVKGVFSLKGVNHSVFSDSVSLIDLPDSSFNGFPLHLVCVIWGKIVLVISRNYLLSFSDPPTEIGFMGNDFPTVEGLRNNFSKFINDQGFERLRNAVKEMWPQEKIRSLGLDEVEEFFFPTAK